MSKMKNYAESILFQSIITLSGSVNSSDNLICLYENYISRLGYGDVPKTARNLLDEVKSCLTTLIEQSGRATFSDEMWASKHQSLLILITELYSDVVAWNAVEQYISASKFLMFTDEQRGINTQPQSGLQHH